MLIDCTCGQTNRIDPKKKSRCGKCKRDFTPRELVKARPEPPPQYDLDNEDDSEEEDDERCTDCGRKLNEDGECPKCD